MVKKSSLYNPIIKKRIYFVSLLARFLSLSLSLSFIHIICMNKLTRFGTSYQQLLHLDLSMIRWSTKIDTNILPSIITRWNNQTFSFLCVYISRSNQDDVSVCQSLVVTYTYVLSAVGMKKKQGSFFSSSSSSSSPQLMEMQMSFQLSWIFIASYSIW